MIVRNLIRHTAALAATALPLGALAATPADTEEASAPDMAAQQEFIPDVIVVKVPVDSDQAEAKDKAVAIPLKVKLQQSSKGDLDVAAMIDATRDQLEKTESVPIEMSDQLDQKSLPNKVKDQFQQAAQQQGSAELFFWNLWSPLSFLGHHGGLFGWGGYPSYTYYYSQPYTYYPYYGYYDYETDSTYPYYYSTYYPSNNYNYHYYYRPGWRYDGGGYRGWRGGWYDGRHFGRGGSYYGGYHGGRFGGFGGGRYGGGGRFGGHR